MPDIVDSIRAEYLRYKQLAEKSIAQLGDEQLSMPGPSGGNSIAVVVWHISGNLRSRFTDFLTTDGEKPWRHRDEEFENRTVTRSDLLEKWEQGWTVLLDALSGLADDRLHETAAIRRQSMHVHEALHRSLAHTACHVGQIVYIAKALRGDDWTSLSIPPGESERWK